MFKYMICLW